MSSRTGAVAKLLFVDLLGSVAWFPIWWYTKGLRGVIDAAMNAIRYRSQSFGLKIWIKNFFVPMYGQHDLTGRLVSVFMRFFVLIGRLIALGVESVIYGAGIALWIVAPVLFLAMMVTSFVQGTFFHNVPQTAL
jgi:hypothetical protein